MSLRKVIIDTNVYINWLNRGLHEDIMLGRGLTRYLSGVVLMELAVGARTLPARRALGQLARAYRAGGRCIGLQPDTLAQAGEVLQRLHDRGHQVHRASLVNDVLVALSARVLGATVLTMDRDFLVVQAVVDFKCELLAQPTG
ncbi:MAG: PIN domain-containing protein [Polyangiaceae bacterium]|nr:PIN domain-containing protein [Polyangiaceae bacterium]